jgi:hypothetical protein
LINLAILSIGSKVSGLFSSFHSGTVFSIVVHQAPASHEVVVGREPCCICLESGEGDPWFSAPCNHSYHLKCIQGWPQGTCPLCRKAVWV